MAKNSLSESKLDVLALTSIENDTLNCIDMNEVIDTFVNTKTRKQHITYILTTN